MLYRLVGTALFTAVLVMTSLTRPLPAADKAAADDLESLPWPPPLSGLEDGVTTVKLDRFLQIPEAVAAFRNDDGVAPFVVAQEPPMVDLAIHRNLGTAPAARRLWSSWGDICLADDGRVYVGIGDHGHDLGSGPDGDGGRCLELAR